MAIPQQSEDSVFATCTRSILKIEHWELWQRIVLSLFPIVYRRKVPSNGLISLGPQLRDLIRLQKYWGYVDWFHLYWIKRFMWPAGHWNLKILTTVFITTRNLKNEMLALYIWATSSCYASIFLRTDSLLQKQCKFELIRGSSIHLPPRYASSLGGTSKRNMSIVCN